MSTELGQAHVTIGARFGALRRGLSAARGMVSSAMGAITGTIGKAMEGFKRLGGIGGLGLAGAVGVGVKKWADFEHELAKVSTMLDAQTMPLMKGFRTELEDMSMAFGQSTATLTDGLYDTLSAGVPAAKAINTLNVAVRAAVGGMTTTKNAADAMTTALNAFQLGASRAADVADVMALVVNRGKITFDQLSEGLGGVAGVAATTGITFQELAAMIATATRTLKPAEALTAVRGLLVALLDPQEDALKLARQYNIELGLERIRREGVVAVLKDMLQLSVKERSIIGGRIQGFTALAAILQDVAGFEEDVRLAFSAGGRSMEAFLKMQNTLSFRMARMKEWFVNKLVKLGEFSVKVWDRVKDQLAIVWQGIAEGFRGLIAQLADMVRGPYRTLTEAMGELWIGFAKHMATVDIPFRKLIVMLGGGWNAVKSILDFGFDWLVNKVNNVISIVWFALKAAARGMAALVKPIGQTILREIGTIATKIAEAFIATYEQGGILGGWQKQLLESGAAIFANLGLALTQGAGRLPFKQAFAQEWDAMVAGVADDWQQLKDTLEDAPKFPIEDFARPIQRALRELDAEAMQRMKDIETKLRAAGMKGKELIDNLGAAIADLRAKNVAPVGGAVGNLGAAAGTNAGVAAARVPTGMERWGGWSAGSNENIRLQREIVRHSKRAADAVERIDREGGMG